MAWSKHNKKAGGAFSDVKAKEEFYKVSEFVEKFGAKFTCRGGWINNKSKFGAHPVIFAENEKTGGIVNVDAVKGDLDMWKDIFEDPDDIQTIKDGKAECECVLVQSKLYGEYWTINLI